MQQSPSMKIIPAIAMLVATAVSAQQAPAQRPGPGAAADGTRPPMQIEQPKKHRHAFSFTAQRREAKTDLAISNAQSGG